MIRLVVGLVLIAVPVLELALLIKIGQWIGVWATAALVVTTAFTGILIISQQSFTVMRRTLEAVSVFSWAKRIGSPTEMTFLDRSTTTPGSVSQIIPYIPDPGQNLALAGSSDDGSVAFFEFETEGPGTGTPLRAGAAPHKPNLYVWDRETGVTRLAGVLNNGKAPVNGAFAGPYNWLTAQTTFGGAISFGGSHYTRDEHVISADGSAVYFTAGGSGQLYRRVNPTKPQSEVVINGRAKKTASSANWPARSTSPPSKKTARARSTPSGRPHPAAFQTAAPDGATPSSCARRCSPTTPIPVPKVTGGDRHCEARRRRTRRRRHQPALPARDRPDHLTDGEHIDWADSSNATIGRAKLDGTSTPTDFDDAFIVPGNKIRNHRQLEPGVITSAPSRPRYVAVATDTSTGPTRECLPTMEASETNRVKVPARSVAPADGRGDLVPGSIEPEFITGHGSAGDRGQRELYLLGKWLRRYL